MYGKLTSMSKAVLNLTDGSRRVYYSNDINNRRFVKSRTLGIKRLLRMVWKKRNIIYTAIIYDNNSGKELLKYEQGKWNI